VRTLIHIAILFALISAAIFGHPCPPAHATDRAAADSTVRQSPDESVSPPHRGTARLPAKPRIAIAVFRSPSCGHCRDVEKPALAKLAAKTGVHLDVTYYNIDDIEKYKLLLAAEEEYGDTGNEFPVVVAGGTLLGGEEEVRQRLEKTLREIAAAGGCGLPDILTEPPPADSAATPGSAGAGKPVYAAFFSQAGCLNCERMLSALKYLKSRYPSFDFRAYDTRDADAARLLEVLYEAAGTPEEDRRKLPALFVGRTCIQDEDITQSAVEDLIVANLEDGTPVPWEVDAGALADAEGRILARFATLGPLTVIVAGLIDGINPCAFATIVFFVSYLAATGRGRRQIITVGLCFAGAVFTTYLAVGMGAFRALLEVKAYTAAAYAIDAAAGCLALVFGLLSLRDYFKVRAGKAEEMALVLPGFLKKRIRLDISRQLRMRGVVTGALAAGVLVSFFELACTGQVYLPTLVLISGDAAMKARALGYLALYNLMFVAPLLAILAATVMGLGRARLSAFFRRHLGAAKLAMAALFLAIGAVLLANLET